MLCYNLSALTREKLYNVCELILTLKIWLKQLNIYRDQKQIPVKYRQKNWWHIFIYKSTSLRWDQFREKYSMQVFFLSILHLPSPTAISWTKSPRSNPGLDQLNLPGVGNSPWEEVGRQKSRDCREKALQLQRYQRNIQPQSPKFNTQSLLTGFYTFLRKPLGRIC